MNIYIVILMNLRKRMTTCNFIFLRLIIQNLKW